MLGQNFLYLKGEGRRTSMKKRSDSKHEGYTRKGEAEVERKRIDWLGSAWVAWVPKS